MYVQYWTDYLTDSLAIDIHVYSAITVGYTKVLGQSVMDYMHMTAKIGSNEDHNQSLTLWAEQATDK